MHKNNFPALGGKLPKAARMSLEVVGGLLIIAAWQITASFHLLKNGVVGTPLGIVRAIPSLIQNDLVGNALYSIVLNLMGYLEAAAIGLPLGFLIALNPTCRALGERYVAALRYAPLSALLGAFMLAFGISSNMKVQFLAFGLLIYVIPQVIQRVDEVEKVYLQTMQTVGASKWQMIRWVYWPAVTSRVFTDFVVLSAISWTYIIIAEVVNMSDGGIGALSYRFYRQSRIDSMYATILVIILIGFAFDKIGNLLDRVLFKYKYAQGDQR